MAVRLHSTSGENIGVTASKTVTTWRCGAGSDRPASTATRILVETLGGPASDSRPARNAIGCPRPDTVFTRWSARRAWRVRRQRIVAARSSQSADRGAPNVRSKIPALTKGGDEHPQRATRYIGDRADPLRETAPNARSRARPAHRGAAGEVACFGDGVQGYRWRRAAYFQRRMQGGRPKRRRNAIGLSVCSFGFRSTNR